jgi:hypothetical protein
VLMSVPGSHPPDPPLAPDGAEDGRRRVGWELRGQLRRPAADRCGVDAAGDAVVVAGP